MVAFFNSICFHLKTYDQTNFFKHTFCEFQQVNDFEIPKDKYFISKSNSLYYYTKEGVYRKSNHWGRVANCRWKLISNKSYKNQQTVIAFAKWDDFFSLNETEKLFYISVNFNKKTVKIQPDKTSKENYLFTYIEAQKRVKKIKHLFKEEKWATYFEGSLDEIRLKIISEYINSDASLKQIKINL